jgi:uncharacterized protein (TIGR00304 family)
MFGPLLFNIGVFLILVGFTLAFVILILIILKSFKGERKVKGGGTIIIGPFPIVFGTDSESVKILLTLSIILVIVVLIVMIFSYHVIR